MIFHIVNDLNQIGTQVEATGDFTAKLAAYSKFISAGIPADTARMTITDRQETE